MGSLRTWGAAGWDQRSSSPAVCCGGSSRCCLNRVCMPGPVFPPLPRCVRDASRYLPTSSFSSFLVILLWISQLPLNLLMVPASTLFSSRNFGKLTASCEEMLSYWFEAVSSSFLKCFQLLILAGFNEQWCCVDLLFLFSFLFLLSLISFGHLHCEPHVLPAVRGPRFCSLALHGSCSVPRSLQLLCSRPSRSPLCIPSGAETRTECKMWRLYCFVQ